MPALADRLFSWTVPIERVEGKKGWDLDRGENLSEVGWWWEGTQSGAPISPCCASEFTCFFFLFTLPLRLPLYSYLVLFYHLSCKGCLRRQREHSLSGAQTQSTHRIFWGSFTSYIPKRWSKLVPLQWNADRKSIFVCINDFVAAVFLSLAHIYALFFLIPFLYWQHHV